MNKISDKVHKRKLAVWMLWILLFAVVYLLFTGLDLARSKEAARQQWDERFTHADLDESYLEGADPMEVYAATYITSIDGVDLKQSSFTVSFEALFCWDAEENPDFTMQDQFRVVDGTIAEQSLAQTFTHENMRYERYRIRAEVSQSFETERFPLSSYQLRFFLAPLADVRTVHMRAMDAQYSGVDKDLNVSGFKVTNAGVSNYYEKAGNSIWYSEFTDNSEEAVYSEILTCVELNRSSIGLYLKCTIVLWGVSIWLFISLFLCVYHEHEGLILLPAVVFGLASNILVGANLVPDALETGLLEYVNIWGMVTIFLGSVIMAALNRMRTNREDEAFCLRFGKSLAFEFLIIIVAGYIILPVCAYQW